jgi:hypothetical protein
VGGKLSDSRIRAKASGGLECPDTDHGLRESRFGRVPVGAGTCAARLLDHHKKEDAALVPTANPAYAPAINAVADYGRLADAEKLGLNFHSHPCMARLGGNSQGDAGVKQRNCLRLDIRDL